MAGAITVLGVSALLLLVGGRYILSNADNLFFYGPAIFIFFCSVVGNKFNKAGFITGIVFAIAWMVFFTQSCS